MNIKSLILIASVFMFAGCFGPNYEKTTIKDVVSDVKGNLIGFNTDNVTSIGTTIKGNINALDNLIKYIDKAKTYEEAFPHIVTTVDQLAKNYKSIADKKESIKNTLNSRINKVKQQRELARGKLIYVQKKINVTQLALASETVDYKKAALKTTLKFQKQEYEVWDKFATGMQFNELISRLEAASGGINQFIDILSSNSMVYTQASTTLHAVQDYKNAKADLQEVLTVVELGDDLIQSWDKLSIVIDGAMSHIEEVEAINFGSQTTSEGN